MFHQTCDLEQTYDFSAGELMSHFTLKASGVAITCEVLTFASREDPTLVCQEMSLIPSNDRDVQVWMGLELLAGHSGTFATLRAQASRLAMERYCGRARVDQGSSASLT